jgi:hypothetical protein
MAVRRAVAAIPPGGADASRTPAAASWDSRYFCTMNPPIEWPMTTGGVGNSLATETTSWT